MKNVLYASVIAMGCTIAVAAQGGMAADKTKMMDKDAAKTVAVTGCVAESDGHFMLKNATMPDHAMPMSYALSGGTLKPHVGHKVEVTGMMKMTKDMPKDMPKDKMAAPAMGKEPMAGDMKKEAMATAGTLDVKELKMIAASCS